MSPTIDPSEGVHDALSAITSAVNFNLASVLAVAGGLLAVVVAWALAAKLIDAQRPR